MHQTEPRRRIIVAAILAATACGQLDSDASSNGPRAEVAADTATPDYEYLRDEALLLVEFLRGRAPLDTALLADSITLYIAPEGGGAQRRTAKQQLRRRAEWRVGQATFLPSDGLTQLTLRPGAHFRCLPTSLGNLYPALAGTPHIGAMLASPATEGCMHTWNLTLLFNDDLERPVLTAVVYDQWEW